MQTKVKFVVQNYLETASNFSSEVNSILEKISKEYPNSNPILFPTSSSDGRQTVLIQWSIGNNKPDNIMIKGLAIDIIKSLNLQEDNFVEHKTEIIYSKINEFINGKSN